MAGRPLLQRPSFASVRRTSLVLLATGALGLALRNVTLEQDPVRSLADPDPVRARLFSRYQTKNPLQGKVFVEANELDAAGQVRVDGALRRAGYREVALFAPPPLADLVAMAPLLPAPEAERAMSDDAVRRRVAGVLELAGLPGTTGLLEAVERDPLGLAPVVAARLGFTGEGAGAARPVRVFQRDLPLDYDRVGALQRDLEALAPAVHFIGGDFFSYENYLAVQHDIVVNSALSLLLNLIIFFGFTGRWALLGLLFLGSVVSYLTGLLGTWLFYADIQAVVLAYTSTFVGFNNESLVHLSGVEDHRRRTTLLGISSAIGTTLIGFLVLLAGHSTIVRQMAIASIGGMVGFLLFLVPYRSTLRGVRFRTFAWRKVPLSPRALVALCVAALAGIAAAGLPAFATRIDGFRYETPVLAAAVSHFSERLEQLALEDVVAVPAAGEPGEALEPLVQAGLVDLAHHPLAAWQPVKRQRETLRLLEARYAVAVRRFSAMLLDAGVRIEPSAAAFREMGAWAFLERVGALGPVLWSDQVGGQRFVLAGLRRGSPLALRPDLVPVSPRRYYDTLLTGLSRELGWLFVAGLAVMAVYLGALQRDAVRVLYVFAPLLLAGLAFAVWARLGGASLNIIHVMGFSLVIALAMDYTAVAVSSDHAPEELSKVLLTGLSTLATFGVLVFARHPVLRDLGVTVVIGCGLSLAFAVVFRLRTGRGGEA